MTTEGPKPDAIVMSTLMLVVILVVWLGVAGPLVRDFNETPYKTFKDFQTLFSVLLAGIGIYVAWKNASRLIMQGRESMVIDIIKREEDRMEAELPGLEAAAAFIRRMISIMDAKPEYYCKKFLIEEGLSIGEDTMKKEIDERLKSTDSRTRREVINALSLIISRIKKLDHAELLLRMIDSMPNKTPEYAEHGPPALRRAVEESANSLRPAVDNLKHLETSIQTQIVEYHRRIPIFRQKIENSLSDLQAN